jgi:hypothetical protein
MFNNWLRVRLLFWVYGNLLDQESKNFPNIGARSDVKRAPRQVATILELPVNLGARGGAFS